MSNRVSTADYNDAGARLSWHAAQPKYAVVCLSLHDLFSECAEALRSIGVWLQGLRLFSRTQKWYVVVQPHAGWCDMVARACEHVVRAAGDAVLDCSKVVAELPAVAIATLLALHRPRRLLSCTIQ